MLDINFNKDINIFQKLYSEPFHLGKKKNTNTKI